MSAINSVTPLYNPHLKDREELINEFVVRIRIFETIFNDLKRSKMKYPEQHYLIIGQRGSGKTTLLRRLQYAIEDEESLKDWLIPITLNEEQYSISELANLWETIAEYLEDYKGFQGIVAEMQANVEKTNYEDAFFRVLINQLDKKKKKLVLLIDNIGDLLTKFSELEVKRLREILQTIPHIRLIAGSPVVLEDIYDYHYPLLEFFKTIYLEGLTQEEMNLLLRTLAKKSGKEDIIEKIINETPERVEVLRRLTGGVTRTVVMLFNIFADNQDGKAIKDFYALIDQATPLYKHNMDDLKPQQQKIMDAVAKNWDGITVKELTEKLRMESKQISAQLGMLEKNQLILKRKPDDSKNMIYMLQDRFFNIWYLMRHGRRYDKKRVEWLVRFLESWLDKEELEQRVIDHIANLNKGTYDEKAALLMMETYLQCALNFETKVKLYNKTKENYIVAEASFPYNDAQKAMEKYLLEGENIKAFELADSDIAFEWHIYLKLAIESGMAKNHEKERIYLEKSIESNKDEPFGYFGLAKYYLHYSINHQQSEFMFKNAISKSIYQIRKLNNGTEPKTDSLKQYYDIISNSYLNLGGLNMTTLAKETKAKKYLLKAGKMGLVMAYLLLAQMELAKNENNKIMQYLESAFNLGTKEILPLNTYCLRLIYSRNYTKAKEVLDRINAISINDEIDNFLVLSLNANYHLAMGNMELSLNYFEKSIGYNVRSKYQEVVERGFREYLVKEQYNSLLKLFNNDEYKLKDQFKPYYYVLMYLIGNKNEMLKMGDELKETVDEVIKYVENRQGKNK